MVFVIHEKIIANKVTDKGLISKIYKQLLQLNFRYIFNPSYFMSSQIPLQCCKANHLNQFNILHRVEAKFIYMLELWKWCYFTYFTFSFVVFIICFPLSTTAGKSVLHVAMCSTLLISPAWDSTLCISPILPSTFLVMGPEWLQAFSSTYITAKSVL